MMILTTNNILLPFIVSFISVILVIVLIFVYLEIHASKKKQKVFNNVLEIFNNLVEEKKLVNYYLRKSDDPAYDIYFETKNNIYFIKIVYNFSNAEICINNAVKWETRTSPMDNKTKFIEGIDSLMIKKFDSIKKKVNKLYIVYPNAHSILKYINECEMIFVDEKTDCYGANVITYQKLKDNNQIIDTK